MADQKKKSGKFITSILIGGALGSIAALVFGSKKNRKTIGEKAHEIQEKVEGVLGKKEEKKGFFSHFFKR